MNSETVTHGKHVGKKWSDVPIKYLQFVSKTDGSLRNDCLIELQKRKSQINQIKILPSAIDSASFSIISKWSKSVIDGSFKSGFYSYVSAISKQALRDGEQVDNGSINYRGFYFEFKFNQNYPTLISISKK